jgi:TRAP-type C4-dicarboxylate transport system permease small subunit
MSGLRLAGAWLARRAENIAAAMLAAMFAAFILQIVFRYGLNLPIGWTHEVSVILWLWLVLFGAAFVISEREEIRLDIIYGSSSRRTRRIMTIVSAVGLVALYGVSLPAVVDYVAFMKVERTAYLKIRFDWLYSIYVAFAVASILRYLWIGWRAVTGPGPDAIDPTKAGSGV